jgi:peptide methionine sulfoxide reductase MsrA
MWQQRKDNWHAQVTYQQYLAKNPFGYWCRANTGV